MEPLSSYPANPLSRRLEYQGVYATVRYFGPLKHLPADKHDPHLWVGVEWDDPSRGKHNGTVDGVVYFVTEDNKNSGSLLKIDKVDFGIDMIDGLLLKYFKEDPKTLKKQIVESINSIENGENGEKQTVNEEKKEENGKIETVKPENDEKQQEKDATKEAISSQKEKVTTIEQQQTTSQEEEKKNSERPPALIEYDEDAYFETIKKHKKKVEFIGFDRIWKKINNLKEIKELSLQELRIATLPPPLVLRHLLPNLKHLALEKNLLFDFQQVLHIGFALPHLESLSLSHNRLKEPEGFLEDVKEIELFTEEGKHEKIQIDTRKAFQNLKTLILIDMNLTWAEVSKILGVFTTIEELILCRNKLNDFSELTIDINKTLPNLKFLNLEESLIGDFSGINKFGGLAKLEKLTISKNFLQKIGEVHGFSALQTLSIEANLFEDLSVLYELAQFENLRTLRVKANPLINVYSGSYVRQRAVAENKNIHTINGSILKKYERKDCEIFYLRKTFEDYFKATNTKYYEYDFNDFLTNYCKIDHPSIPRLLKIYGNPFEMDPNAKKEQNAPVVQKNMMLILKITALYGPFLGKDPIKKKFPDSTTIVNLKGFLAKFLNVSSEKMVVYYKNPNQGAEPMEVLEEELKSLAFYSVVDGGELFVDEKS